MASETVHSKVYSLLIETYIKDKKEKNLSLMLSARLIVSKRKLIGHSPGA